MAWYLLLFMFAWAISFSCSGFEIGFLSVNELKINALAKQGKKLARILQKLLKNKEKVITTILIGNNIALVLMTFAFGGIIISIFKQGFPEALETIILTIIVFMTCELFPKSLFRIYSFELTYRFGWLFYAFYFVFLPISALFEFISKKFKARNETINPNSRLNEIAAEGVRRRLLPAGVSIITQKFSEKHLRFGDICKSVRPIKYCGRNNITINSAQSMDEIIESGILWNYDTIECFDIKKGTYYNTCEILDSLFQTAKKLKIK